MPEVPENEAVAANASSTDQLNVMQLAWWKTLNHHVVAVAVLLQPNSGSAERVFSMYTWSFDDDQDNALEDYKATAVMMRFNEQNRHRV